MRLGHLQWALFWVALFSGSHSWTIWIPWGFSLFMTENKIER